MIFTKYAGDYKIDENDPKYRKTIYCGKYYSIEENPEDKKTRSICLLVFSLVETIVFVLSLSFPNSLARLFYVVVPYAFNALMLYGCWISFIKYFFNRKELLQRKEKDDMLDKMKSNSAIGLILCLFSFGGSIISAALKLFKFGSAEIGFLTGLVVGIVCFFGINSLARAIKVKEISEERAEDEGSTD